MNPVLSLRMTGAVLVMTVLTGCFGSGGRGGDPWDYMAPQALLNPGSSRPLPDVDPRKVFGNLTVAGSSTLYPLSESIARRFRDEGYTGRLSLDSIGSTGGFERWAVRGEVDIAASSRSINEEETASATALGRVPLAFQVGVDALVVAVSPENTFVENLTWDELRLIFSKAVLWSQVRPEWPDLPVKVFSPGTDSGSFDFFVDQVFSGQADPLLQAQGIQFSEDDAILVRGISSTPGAVGYFGYSYYLENSQEVRAVKIQGKAPSPEAVARGNYGLARPLYLYTSQDIILKRPQVGAFLGYYLSVVQEEAKPLGILAPHPRIQSQTWDLWEKVTGWKWGSQGWTNELKKSVAGEASPK